MSARWGSLSQLTFCSLLVASLGPTLARAQAQTPEAPAAPPVAAAPAADGGPAETPPARADAGSGAAPAPAPAGDAPGAAASEPPAEAAAAPGGGGDMVVTAQRYEQDVQKTP